MNMCQTTENVLGKLQEFARSWRGPKSVCMCGHSGDGDHSEHADVVYLGTGDRPGHRERGAGQCVHPGCKCNAFTWARWTLAFGDALAKMKAKLGVRYAP